MQIPPREGYDRWAEGYDQTPNPVVAMDARLTGAALAPAPGERILDAGCGTGRHLTTIVEAGADAVGLDFSHGMLGVARRKHPQLPLAVADLHSGLPLQSDSFDAVVCALVGEHLEQLQPLGDELYRVLRPGGRIVFSVYHPRMAQAGYEANFEAGGVEYRLGAVCHTLADYQAMLAPFEALTCQEYCGDQALVELLPKAVKFLGFPLLVLLRGCKPAA